MAMAWYSFPISQPHSSDDGVDIATPDNTPVSFPDTVKITDASYHTYGGEVVGAVPGSGYSEYFIHLNQIYVQPGQTVPAGTVIGTTGGGVGDLVLHGGTVQPAQSQSWYAGASTGYHTEFGAFAGETLAGFDQGWGNPQRQLDPTPQLNALKASGGQFGSILLATNPQGNALGLSLPGVGGVGDLGSSAASAVASGFSNAANTITSGAQTALKRGGVFVMGLVLVIFGIFLIVRPGVQQKQDEAKQAIAGVAPQVAANKLAPRPAAPAQPAPQVHIKPADVHVHNTPAPVNVQIAAPVRKARLQGGGLGRRPQTYGQHGGNAGGLSRFYAVPADNTPTRPSGNTP